MRRAGRAGRETAAVVVLAVVGSSLGAQTPSAAPATVAQAGVRIDSLLDLETVIERARVASPAIAQSVEGLRVARSGLRVSNGACLPTLSVSTAALRSNVLSASGGPGTGTTASAEAYSAGLASSVELFTGGRGGADRARAAGDLTAATATDRSQQYVVTLLAKRSYYDALRGTDLLAAAGARIARAERGLK